MNQSPRVAAVFLLVCLAGVAASAAGPPIISFGLEDSANRNPRAFRPGETLDFFVLTTNSAGDTAQAALIAVSDGSRFTVGMPYLGGNLYRSATTGATLGLSDGFYDTEFTLCNGSSFPSDCTETGACTCQELPVTPSRVWIDTNAPDLVAASLGAIRSSGQEVEPNRTHLVLNESDSLEIRATSASYDVTDSCSFFLVFTSTIPHDQGNEYRLAFTFPPAVVPDGYHDVPIDLEDGLGSERAIRWFKFDNHTPDPPSVSVSTSAPVGSEVTVGDTLIVRARCSDSSEDTLLTRFGIDLDSAGGTTTLVSQADAVSAEHLAFDDVEYTYVVPADLASGDGVTGTLMFWSTVSDGANRSANTLSGDTFTLDTTTPEVSEVRVEVDGTNEDCFAVGSEFTFEVFGTSDVRLASIDIVRDDGQGWITEIPLTWELFRYVGARTITQADIDDAPFEIDGHSFVMRARIGRSTQLWSDPVESRAVMFFSLVPASPEVNAVGSLPPWTFSGDEIAVVDPSALVLEGSGPPQTDVVAEAVGGSGITTTVAQVGADGTWAGSLDLTALGIDLDDGSPDQLSLVSVVCGAESPLAVYDLRLDVTIPGTPVIVPAIPVAGSVDTVRASATDDAPLTGILDVCTGDSGGGGVTCVEIEMIETTMGETTEFVAAVPSTLITRYGVRYRVRVTDGAHVVESESAPAVSGTGADTGQPGSAFEGVGVAPDAWHLISFPTALAETNSALLFSTLGAPASSRWGLFVWRPAMEGGEDVGKYVSNASEMVEIAPGGAAWFKWLRSESGGGGARFEFSGDALPLEPFALDLEAGWNQIGSPFAIDVAWPSGAPVLRRYANDVYTSGPITRVEPFVGYFVFSADAQTVTIDPDAAISFEPPPRHPEGFAAADPRGWALQVVAENDVWKDADNYAAVHPEARREVDDWDLGEFPRPEVEPRLSFETESGRLLSADVRPADGALHRWKMTVMVPFTPSGADVILRWPDVETVPDEVELRVIDRRTGEVVDPRIVPRLRIEAIAGERYPLEIVAGVGTELDGALDPARPTRLILLPAFPNPFRITEITGNTGVRLRYEVPEAGSGTITVFDVGGRAVRRHLIDHGAPGRYSVVWDGRDGSGAASASGVYVVEIEFEGERRGQKLVVLPR